MHPFEEHIIDVPDFPKKGVMFKDIFPLLEIKLDEVITEMTKDVNWDEIDYIAGIESRGFVLGVAIAQKYGKGFIPIRKQGKLPPPTITEEYTLEYGTDCIEMKENLKSAKIVLVDDVLATGGTMKAAIKMCEKNNFTVQNTIVLINLAFLNSFKQDGISYNAVLEYD